jgi:hypothetical protein
VYLPGLENIDLPRFIPYLCKEISSFMAKKVFLEIHSSPTYYTMIGISCHLKDYRLSFLLNRQMEYSLVKLEDLKALLPGKKEQTEFSLYHYRDEDRYNNYSLIANRNQECILVPGLKQTDFLLLVEGEFKKNQKDSLLKTIRSIPNILTAFEIQLTEIRNYEFLLTDIEMHLMNVFKKPKSKFQSLTKK